MDSAPRIVFGVTVDYSIRLLGKIPESLAKDGWDVHVVSAPGSELDALDKAGCVTCHRLPMEREPRTVRDFRSLIGWIITLNAIRPDVVSIGTPKASLLGLTAAWLLRIPARVYFLRGLRLETTKGSQRLVLSFFERLTAACSTHIVSVSPSLRDEYLASKLTRPSKVLVLGHGSSKGVDLERFRPSRPNEARGLGELAAKIGLQPGIPVIGLVGRQHVDKGIRFFAEALRHPTMVDMNYQVLVIGEDETNGLLSNSLQESGRHSVVLEKASSLERYYRLMTLFCLPTQREGFPNVVLESLASGVPAITTDATGARDSLADGINGFRVNRKDTAALAAAMRQVLSNRALREVLGSNCRPWVERRFSESFVVSLHKDFYKRIFPVQARRNLGLWTV